MNATKELNSIGRLCGLLQRSPNEIRKAADELGITAAVRINAVDHFDGTSADLLFEHFRKQTPTAETADGK